MPSTGALHPGQNTITEDKVLRLPRGMALPTLALVTFSVALTVAAGPLVGVSQRAADELVERTPYIDAVLGDVP